jgi:hypothetical protein
MNCRFSFVILGWSRPKAVAKTLESMPERRSDVSGPEWVQRASRRSGMDSRVVPSLRFGLPENDESCGVRQMSRWAGKPFTRDF